MCILACFSVKSTVTISDAYSGSDMTMFVMAGEYLAGVGVAPLCTGVFGEYGVIVVGVPLEPEGVFLVLDLGSIFKDSFFGLTKAALKPFSESKKIITNQ